jgi:DNA-binding winged helix-turn-helix (wHTH) protein
VTSSAPAQESAGGRGTHAMKMRYRFDDFTLSAATRTLRRAGREVPLIPRYFDLLLLLVERRQQAVHRQEILDAVWSDVVVSDGALSQAVRTLRRSLGDVAREPLFIRTVSRHGYRFVHDGVVEEPDGDPAGTAAGGGPAATREGDPAGPPPEAPRAADRFEPLLCQLLDQTPGEGDRAESVRREAAEALHALGTAEALARLDRRPGHEAARALLRDARWDVPGAGDVPLLGQPGSARAGAALVGLRLRRAARLAGLRWGSAAAGGAVAGALTGFLGGVVLHLGPGADSPISLPMSLAVIGLLAGGVGAAGVGAGLAFAEAIARGLRGAALVVCGALSGGACGLAVNLAIRALLTSLFGHDLPALGGGLEGMAMGAAAGLGYAISTPRPRGGGMATPHGLARAGAALATGACCAVTGSIVCLLGGHLAGTSLNLLAHAFEGSHVGLAPLAALLGEADPGPLTGTLSGGLEGFFFGLGLITGLTRRPR